jgi:hypothetical protein
VRQPEAEFHLRRKPKACHNSSRNGKSVCHRCPIVCARDRAALAICSKTKPIKHHIEIFFTGHSPYLLFVSGEAIGHSGQAKGSTDFKVAYIFNGD